MPTYEYECQSCKFKFDKFQSIMDEPVKTCPKCGKKVTKLVSAGSGIILKGKGFYQTDYKNCPSKNGDKKKEPGKASSCDSCPCSEN